MKVREFVKKYTMVLALVVVFVFFTVLTGGRLVLAQNISNLLLQNAYVLIMACGMLLCILTGGNVDLSIGSTLCLSAAMAAKLLDLGAAPGAAILAALAVSALIGVWQGWLIGYIHIPPFICTLAGMFLFRGIARVILDSRTISIMNPGYLKLFTSYIRFPGEENQHVVSALIIGLAIGAALTAWSFLSRAAKVKQGYAVPSVKMTVLRTAVFDALIIGYSCKLMGYKGIPVMLLWILAVVLIFAFITGSTVFGRYFYAVGGNEKATKLSGIDPRRVYFWAYFLMSVLAGLSGLLVGARIGSVDGNMGNSYEMDAIASCFIGGASAYGGSGTVPGIMIGAILLGVINQGMSILGLPDQYQYIVKGAVLLAAVVFDVVSNHKTGKS
ncbi:sugar ABC transporter permease [Lachnoclostridium sp. Marseille-P6806]|uniref:sugar ABC transporter permease n=1 Tax=Lachnoclostridium sp. Marseille-P6806 TaxID=2364793 RepID=UPI00102F6832|nr:sugar ABC transporter permease [Lachnoclostridium sp. Marseille-P6806]